MIRALLLSLYLMAPATWAQETPASVVEPVAPHHESIGERAARALRRAGLPDGVAVTLISALPIVELRGAIPVGHLFKMNPWLVYALAVFGNMVPVPLILWLMKPAAGALCRFALGKRFIDWLFARTRRKTADIEKYETLGLAIFVAIPLPATGAWTGALAAFLLGMSFRHAVWSILLGVMIAGVIMTVLSLMGWIGAAVAGVVLTALAVSGLWAWMGREKSVA
jgi:uncharacterized membrane protein